MDVADNTGAKKAAAIGVLGATRPMLEMVSDQGHIKGSGPGWHGQKGEGGQCGIVRTRKAIRRNDGSYLPV